MGVTKLILPWLGSKLLAALNLLVARIDTSIFVNIVEKFFTRPCFYTST